METKKILELRSMIHQFIRLFGLLDQTTTPCGFALSVSQVMALQELETEKYSITSLAHKLRLERSSVSRLSDSLVKEGFLRREENSQNRRETLLSLTEKGESTVKTVREQSVQFFQSILGEFTVNEEQQLLKSFGKLTIALSKIREDQP